MINLKMITDYIGYATFDITLSKDDAARIDNLALTTGFSSTNDMVQFFFLNLTNPENIDTNLLNWLKTYKKYFADTDMIKG